MAELTRSGREGAGESEQQTLLGEVEDRWKEEQGRSQQLLRQNRDLIRQRSTAKRQQAELRNQLVYHANRGDEQSARVVEVQAQRIEQLEAELGAALRALRDGGGKARAMLTTVAGVMAHDDEAAVVAATCSDDARVDMLQFRVQQLTLENDELRREQASLRLLHLNTAGALRKAGWPAAAVAKGPAASRAALTDTFATSAPAATADLSGEDAGANAVDGPGSENVEPLPSGAASTVPGAAVKQAPGVGHDAAAGSGRQRRRAPARPFVGRSING
ncbi:hypothetical protein HK405_000868, partial [Cladochytrium tenue]